MTKLLSRDLTAYDFFKSFAVALMIVDHAGYFFFPEDNWWRVAGRLCVPVWFFLIGYARSRDIGSRLWVGLGILLISDVVAGMSLLPLNILGTIILVRLLIDPLMNFSLQREILFWPVFFILALLSLPSNAAAEYGTMSLILAAFGWLVRRRTEYEGELKALFIFALLSFVVSQFFLFAFTQAQVVVLGIGCMAVMGALYYFEARSFPNLTRKLPGAVAALLRLGGRRTLEIYVLHLILFKGLALWLAPERFTLFDWKLFSLSGL